MGGLDMGQTAQHGTIFGYAYLGVGCSGVPVPGGQPWQRSITFVPVALDATAHLVNSRSSVTVTPDAEGYFEAVLWAGAWRAEFADGTSFPFPVVAGTSERLVDLRGYVPPPGTTVQVVALAGVDVETLEPDDPATGEWRVDRLKLGLPRGNQGDKGDAATISVGSTTTGAPGTPADVTNSGDSHNAVFHFTIPAGHDGREVEFGLSATHVQWRYVGDVAWMDLIALSSLVGATGAQGPKGDKGDPAPLPAFTASATTGAPGTDASVSVSGTYPDLSLDLTIPAGAKGDPGMGDVTTGTAQTITGAKTITAPTLVAAQPDTVAGPDIAPALSTWTGANGATWDGTAWTIPAGGTISAPITVSSGAIYHITLTRTGGTGSTAMVVLGTVTAEAGAANATVIPVQSSGSGTQTLTIGGGTWAAIVSGVRVQTMTPASPVMLGEVQIRRSAVTGSLGLGRGAQRSLTTGSSNSAVGYAAQYSLTTGSSNSAVGHAAQYSLTTGSSNSAVGHAAQYSLTTGNDNNAVGRAAQYSLTTGNDNNAVGYAAQYSLTTGSSNSAVGYAAQYSPRGQAAWGTTTASRQTSIGHESGQGSAAQSDDIVTIGYRAVADGAKAMSLGSGATASHAGSVALGADVTTTATGQVAVGPRDVEIQDAARGVILRSPDGSRWRGTISDAGVLTWTKL